MLTIVCVWVGDKYGEEYVHILRDMVSRNLRTEHEFVCVTDKEGEFSFKTIPAEEGLSGWWQKIALFKPGKLPGDRIAFFDLDIAITGSLDDLVETDGIIKDWLYDSYNSTVMTWKSGDHSEIWANCTPALIDLFRYDQDYITSVGGWSILPSEWCATYKQGCETWPPGGAKVISFNGNPKPHMIKGGWVPKVWTVGGYTAMPHYENFNTSLETVWEHMKSACGRSLPWFTGEDDPKSKEMVLVGGSPSVEKYIDEIYKRQAAGATVITVNNAHKFLFENGILSDAHVLLDARVENAAFVKNSPTGIRYFIASQCHPSVFDELEGSDVSVWHPWVDKKQQEVMAEFIDPDKPYVLIGGGSTVGLRALYLGFLSGYRKIHVYGMDSSYRDGKHHAYEQKLNDNEGSFTVEMNGKSYQTSVWMAKQAEEFRDQYETLVKQGASIIVHGDGLIPDMCRLLNQEEQYA